MGINPRHWFQLASYPTAAELAIEPAVAALGIPYRMQAAFRELSLIADFSLPTRKIVLEIDGDSHRRPAQIQKDKEHKAALEAQGWRVCRIDNEDAFSSPVLALARVLDQLGEADLVARLSEADTDPPVPHTSRPRPKSRSAPRRPPAARRGSKSSRGRP